MRAKQKKKKKMSSGQQDEKASGEKRREALNMWWGGNEGEERESVNLGASCVRPRPSLSPPAWQITQNTHNERQEIWPRLSHISLP